MPLIQVKHILPYYEIHNLITEKADETTVLLKMFDFIVDLGVDEDSIDVFNMVEEFKYYTQDFLDYQVVESDAQIKIKSGDKEALDNIDKLKKELSNICEKWGITYEDDFINFDFPSNVPPHVIDDINNRTNDIRSAIGKNRVRLNLQRQQLAKKNGIPRKFLELYDETEMNVNTWIEYVRKELNFNPIQIEEYPYKDFIMKYNIMIKNQEAEERARKEAEKQSQANNPNPFS